jgi:16S rRNA (uracil1498-N3)-methyltransferase
VRIFVDPDRLALGSLVLRGDEHHYLARVRRARPGEVIELVDGEGRRARALIEAIVADATTLRVEAPESIPSLPPFVRALVPLIKGDRMDTCLEKLVEVGVDAIVVWPAERSVVRLHDDRRDARIAKYNAATQAAARQCGRAQVPAVTAAFDLAAAIGALPDTAGLVLDPLAETSIADALRLSAFAIGSSKSGVVAHLTQSGTVSLPDDSMVGRISDVTIASGPEGGLAPDELRQLAAFMSVGLGPRILRAETAPVVAVALVRAATRS